MDYSQPSIQGYIQVNSFIHWYAWGVISLSRTSLILYGFEMY